MTNYDRKTYVKILKHELKPIGYLSYMSRPVGVPPAKAQKLAPNQETLLFQVSMVLESNSSDPDPAPIF